MLKAYVFGMPAVILGLLIVLRQIGSSTHALAWDTGCNSFVNARSAPQRYLLGVGRRACANANEANAGNMEGQYSFGMALLKGDGLPKDAEKALDCFTRAGEQGHLESQYTAGMLLLGSVPEDEEAKKWAAHFLSKAAAQDDVRAIYQVGMLFFDGIGVERDPGKAASWISAAAGKGHMKAQSQMGNLLLGGIGVEKNLEWAFYWFDLAAKQGSVDAMYNLGLMYDSGEGVEEDKDKAIEWLRQAAAQGDEESAEVLQEMTR